jgi:hypothetical protein
MDNTDLLTKLRSSRNGIPISEIELPREAIDAVVRKGWAQRIKKKKGTVLKATIALFELLSK